VPRLAELLAANRAGRAAEAGDAVLRAALPRLRAWQRARLAATYQDLASAERYRAAVEFFLGELYGNDDPRLRDEQLARAAGTFERALPAAALAVLEEAVALELLTQSLDAGLARLLPAAEPITAASYAGAYRALGRRDERVRQIETIVAIGTALDRWLALPGVGTLLRLARAPARAAGFGALQDFLERGYQAFRRLGGAHAFMATVRAREGELLERLYAGEADPFRKGLQCAPSTT
jgi:hypothetical protein